MTLAVSAGATLVLHYSYTSQDFSDAMVHRLNEHLTQLLAGMVLKARGSLGELDMLSPDERTLIEQDWNATRVTYPLQQPVHRLIEDQVALQPDTPALMFGDRHLTYRQLNEQANQLAHRLIELGVGPIGVKSHLAPFLPGHAAMERKEGAVCAAPFGSASILPITWMYIRMMGGAGLKRASQLAILNANYISRRLEEHYPVLYTGSNGLVAHECILDLRPLKDSSGISVDDVAKRLIDFGFHAPTMSFPVAGTLMIEPTESESREELDRFCDAMIAIREEIRAVENGSLDKDDNPLKNAPHTAAELVGEWSHPYSREQAVYPVASLIEAKYWPPVGRVDNVFGDRNLVCACPSIESYA